MEFDTIMELLEKGYDGSIDINSIELLNDSEYCGFSAKNWIYDVTILYSDKAFILNAIEE